MVLHSTTALESRPDTDSTATTHHLPVLSQPQPHPDMRATFSSSRSRHSTPTSPSRELDSSTPRPYEPVTSKHPPQDDSEQPVLYDSASTQRPPGNSFLLAASSAGGGPGNKDPIRSFGAARECSLFICIVSPSVCPLPFFICPIATLAPTRPFAIISALCAAFQPCWMLFYFISSTWQCVPDMAACRLCFFFPSSDFRPCAQAPFRAAIQSRVVRSVVLPNRTFNCFMPLTIGLITARFVVTILFVRPHSFFNPLTSPRTSRPLAGHPLLLEPSFSSTHPPTKSAGRRKAITPSYHVHFRSCLLDCLLNPDAALTVLITLL